MICTFLILARISLTILTPKNIKYFAISYFGIFGFRIKFADQINTNCDFCMKYTEKTCFSNNTYLVFVRHSNN